MPRSDNVRPQRTTIDRAARTEQLGQIPTILWFTGRPGSGKSTIANLVEIRLHQAGLHTFLLDGDNVRHGLCGDLDFTDEDRHENCRRVSEVARLMAESGLIVLVSLISPFRTSRAAARALFGPDEFFEIHVDAPLDVVESRDPKGLYAKARRGQVANFTGIDSPYEPPLTPEIYLNTTVMDGPQAAGIVVETLESAGRFRVRDLTLQ